MAFSRTMLEQLVSWCADSMEPTTPRRDARSVFFVDLLQLVSSQPTEPVLAIASPL